MSQDGCCSCNTRGREPFFSFFLFFCSTLHEPIPAFEEKCSGCPTVCMPSVRHWVLSERALPFQGCPIAPLLFESLCGSCHRLLAASLARSQCETFATTTSWGDGMSVRVRVCVWLPPASFFFFFLKWNASWSDADEVILFRCAVQDHVHSFSCRCAGVVMFHCVGYTSA